jgi:hypothetical protein
MQVYYSAPPPDHNFNRRHVGQNMSIAGTWQRDNFSVFLNISPYMSITQAFRVLAHIKIQKHEKTLRVA